MAGRESNPESLKNKAQDLMKRAKMIEDRRFRLVGEYVMGLENDDFANLNIEEFRQEIRKIFAGKKKS